MAGDGMGRLGYVFAAPTGSPEAGRTTVSLARDSLRRAGIRMGFKNVGSMHDVKPALPERLFHARR